MTEDRVWRVEIANGVYRVWWNRAELRPVRTAAQLEDLMWRMDRRGIGDLVEA
jgi:hypothetical protein